MKYIHELKAWPNFRWNRDRLADALAAVRHRQGRLVGRMEALGFPLRADAVLQTLTADVLKSSEIEGEQPDKAQVRSSLALRLGMDVGGLTPADRHVEGCVEMMLDATQNFAVPLTVERVCGWHTGLFPTGRSGLSKIRVGQWRDGRADAGGFRPSLPGAGPFSGTRRRPAETGNARISRVVQQPDDR